MNWIEVSERYPTIDERDVNDSEFLVYTLDDEYNVAWLIGGREPNSEYQWITLHDDNESVVAWTIFPTYQPKCKICGEIDSCSKC